MEILKSIRNKFGFSQQEMATLLGVTREHYSMIEIGRRMLPAEPALLFAAMLPLFLESRPLPTIAEKITEIHAEEVRTLLNKAKLDLYKAEKDLENCNTAIGQQQNLSFLLAEIPKLNGLTLSNCAQTLLHHLAGINQTAQKASLCNKWTLLNTKRQLCAQAVEAYNRILESAPV